MYLKTPNAPLRLAISVLIPASLFEMGRVFWGTPFSWEGAAQRLVFVMGVVLLSVLTRPKQVAQAIPVWPGLSVLLGICAIGAIFCLVMPGLGGGGWLLLVGCYALLIGIDEIMAARTIWLKAWLVHFITAVVAGAIPVALAQIASRFADEEFFVAIQLLMLSLCWLVIRGSSAWVASDSWRLRMWSSRVQRGALASLCCLGLFGGLAYLVRAYQGSFYTRNVPQYAGITEDDPFLCGELSIEHMPVDGGEVFERLMTLASENPNKGVPEYGMLALATGNAGWAEEFRLGLLKEAGYNRFAGPAGSVKYQQWLAAYRLYYFIRVQEAFPTLFSREDSYILQEWFAAINRRALVVEWVDWMYGLAFSKWPEGPYENQETGLALLSLMELGGIATSELSAHNQTFLRQELRGWEWRFRNTDDALVYQPEWLTNAYYQALLTGSIHQDNLRKSFEWLALQMPPGGASLSYNHPGLPHLGPILYLGADLLRDPRYVWLADQVLSQMEILGRYPSAQPGVERPLMVGGSPPMQGSCLIYGDSGLPNQVGPLAPDKIVLRDGWLQGDSYLLLNLRFSGWHRYKATNAVSLLYWNGPLAVEVLDAQPFGWLPEGRSLFRDKRIPRENLNGLLVERSGLRAVVSTLTGYGGIWAQDPPAYVEVVDFGTSDDLDWSVTRLVDWHGWTQERSLYLYHDHGPIVIVDEARGLKSKQVAVVWHLVTDEAEPAERFMLRNGEAPVAVAFLNLGSAEYRLDTNQLEGGRQRILVQGQGALHLATVFLPGEWVDADLVWDPEARNLTLALDAEKTLDLAVPAFHSSSLP
jgi:hypothetical protein